MRQGSLFFFIPLGGLIPPALLLVFCFTILYVGKALIKINREEISNPKGSILSLVFKTWGINIAALFVSLIIMLFLYENVPFFRGVLSEWGIAYENAYFPAAIYIFCWALLYAACLSFSYPFFRIAITNKSKRIKLFLALILTSVIILIGLMCLLYLAIFKTI